MSTVAQSVRALRPGATNAPHVYAGCTTVAAYMQGVGEALLLDVALRHRHQLRQPVLLELSGSVLCGGRGPPVMGCLKKYIINVLAITGEGTPDVLGISYAVERSDPHQSSNTTQRCCDLRLRTKSNCNAIRTDGVCHPRTTPTQAHMQRGSKY